MWQTPESMMSPRNVTPLASSSSRVLWTSSTCSAIGRLCGANSIPKASDCISAIVSEPVSNSLAGMLPQRLERSSPSVSP